ncbi:uncharacterized protein BT62DRAFT_974301 [Guyanagaster necrorhizus]|uniref:Ribosomal RNA methyltransferase FtsJ domain-containing protein n=1 Tax=Guyanagaster necrorhizus TaxID=856835 RepID=A0A9P8APG2_9AGAR|nr:uncharacterized protein BT62DRAFT_974301 [Guyanagaster necrorhizus MCA 3950]KAG7441832.1 hypothetical protein BT62DRAFT_974301 [Guyanagaster necrorhizus MCA 3950]
MSTNFRSLLIDNGCSDLDRLTQLKQKGRRTPAIQQYFRSQREVADNADMELSERWLKKMKKIMGQIDDHVQWCVPFSGRPFRFLDLGCCPGGFSTYILKKNKQSTGIGVSLDPADGGHPYLIEQSIRDRHTIIFADLTLFQLGPQMISSPSLNFTTLPEDLTTRQFDLALLDAHHLRTQYDSPSDLLAISQIVVAFLSIKFGATVIMKLANPESWYTVRMLFLLDVLSASLTVHKPYAMHRNQGTFYAIAKGVGGKREKQMFLSHNLLPEFQKLWVELRSGNIGIGRSLVPEDLDFIISDKQVEGYASRIAELCEPVWKIQSAALEKLYIEQGI